MRPYTKKALMGIVLWYVCMVVAFMLEHELAFFVSAGLWAVATITFFVFMVQGK